MRSRDSESVPNSREEQIENIAKVGLVNLGWWNLVYAEDRASLLSEYADGFYRAACDMLDNFCGKSVYSDAEALPILYVIFHFCELSLKACIEAKLRILEAWGTHEDATTTGHSISELLDDLARLFEPDEEFLSVETQDFIRKMAELNGRSAQVFRYPFDRRDSIHFDDRPLLSMGLLRAEFASHGGELNGFREWLTSRRI